MYTRIKNTTYLYNLYYRCLLVMSIFLMVIYIRNIGTFTGQPIYVFPLFVAPYLVYFCICYALFHLSVRFRLRQLGWLVLCAALVLGSFWIVKSYYYTLLPTIKVVFYSAWQNNHQGILLNKISQGLFYILLLIVVDYFVFKWLKIKIQSTRLERMMRDRADSSLLSGHFLRRLYQLASKGKKEVDVEVLDFFQSISNKLVAQNVRVALEEEWYFVKRMVALCHDRHFEINGEEHVSQQIWNRSVPSLSLVTWIENAVAYSIDGANNPITLTWINQPDKLVLEIRNRMHTTSIKRGTGNGLRLVNRLYESCKNDRVELQYTIEKNTYFIVKLSFF
ncbi:hypothetical protein EDF67_101485 [Sphingobacterium sp. JUb78]|nr:hypothetical protein EDF67_101485 [Sphingobacterium sp. JUb78]